MASGSLNEAHCPTNFCPYRAHDDDRRLEMCVACSCEATIDDATPAESYGSWEFFTTSRPAAADNNMHCRPRGRPGAARNAPQKHICTNVQATSVPPISIFHHSAKRRGICIPRRAAAKPQLSRRRSCPDNPSTWAVMLCMQRLQRALVWPLLLEELPKASGIAPTRGWRLLFRGWA
jgi:hypothetical protein